MRGGGAGVRVRPLRGLTSYTVINTPRQGAPLHHWSIVLSLQDMDTFDNLIRHGTEGA